MKKHFLRIFVSFISLILWQNSALAAAPATAVQPLAFYDAPGCTELFTLPQSAEMIAIDSETVSGSDWIQVEIQHDGQPLRGYVLADQVSLHGEIPTAAHCNVSNTVLGVTVLAAPAANAPVRGEAAQWDSVTVLQFDGRYIYVEYVDSASGRISRGWMDDWAVQIEHTTYYGDRLPPAKPATGSESIDMRCSALTTLYSAPDTAYPTTILVPEGAIVRCYGELYCGFSIAEFDGNTGYIQTALLSVR